jgi:hypothetical protein
MLRVEVKNFQSIAAETVEITGFSVVVGRSNIGKSALVRAMKAALTGAPADNYVRHSMDCPRVVKGAKSCKCYCSVRIVGPQFDLLWEKGDSVNRYVFNGVEHTVVGKGTPEFLGPEFAPIYIGGDSTPTLLQVADQFRPLFILDRSGTAVADVLSDVAKLDQINDAARAAEKDKRECSSTRKVRDKDLRELDHVLEQYEGLDTVIARVTDVEAMAAAVTALEERAAIVDRFALSVTQLTATMRSLLPVAKLEIPSVSPLIERSSQLRSLTRWRDQLQTKLEASKSLEIVGELVVPELGEATRLAARSRTLSRWGGQLATLKAAFVGLKEAQSAVVPEVAHLASMQLKAREMSIWASRLGVLRGGIAKLEKAVRDAASDETAVLVEFKELEVCPTCRQRVAVMAHNHLGAA